MTLRNIYQHSIDLKKIRIKNSDITNRWNEISYNKVAKNLRPYYTKFAQLAVRIS